MFATKPALALAFLFPGCGVFVDMHTPPPADWPQLAIAVHRVSFGETQARCGSIASHGCAIVNLRNNTCTVYLASDDRDLLDHELEHCHGRDHIGSSYLRDLWARWAKKDNTK